MAEDDQGEFERLVDELHSAAARLRAGEVDLDEATALVERLADLAARIGQSLEREARAPAAGEPPGQETLL